MSSPASIALIGADISHTGRVAGTDGVSKCLMGSMQKNPPPFPCHWQASVKRTGTARGLEAMDDTAEFSRKLGLEVQKTLNKAERPLVFGGDHSCAIGTFSGVAEGLKKPFGLIWMDAHMDLHTPETSPSHNLHGMPLAALMGFGDPKLTQVLSPEVKVLPEHVVLFGTRDFEPEEQALMERLNIHNISAKEVLGRGVAAALQHARQYLLDAVSHYAISLDLDVLDAAEVPHLGTPVPDGLKLKDCSEALEKLDKQQLIAAEIVEFNPAIDLNGSSEKALWTLASALA